MKTVTIPGFIVWQKNDWENKPTFNWFAFDPESMSLDYHVLRPHELTIEVPDDLDMTPAQIAALEKEKEQVRDKYLREVAKLDEKISKLRAITYEPATGETPF